MARILVVDDEEDVRSFVAEALEGDGHTCAEVGSGREAIAELGLRGYDLMITDLKMPNMDGLELVRAVRDFAPDLEIIMLTAHGTIDTAVEAMRLGAFDFLQKPISSPAELRLLASRALERRTLLALKDGALRDEPALPLTYGDEAMKPVALALRKVAATDASVLLSGESGTGKEVAARFIHRSSKRAQGPFVAINCAALSENLLESELFGHEKGAFTGAVQVRRGRIELAAGGTFFLDEIGELRPELQAKLLRVLQERTFERVGGTRSLSADVRLIAATNRDLEAMTRDGRFREDLYHRLAVFPVELPPLRERRADIAPIADALLARIGKSLGRPALSLSDEARKALVEGEWRGNVRELANALERAAILADGDLLGEGLFATLRKSRAPTAAGSASMATHTLEELERTAIERALVEHGGNRRKVATELGIGLRTLYEKLKRLGIGGSNDSE